MSIDLYPEIVYQGDLAADSLGDEYDNVCNEIHEACKSWGANQESLINALGRLNPEARCQVYLRFNQMYNKDLMTFLRQELGDHPLGTALQFLGTAPHIAECAMIHRTIKAMGFKEIILTSIVCGRSNRDMELLKKTYYRVYNEDLGRLLDSELGGDYKELIFSVIQAAEEEYDPSFHTDEKAEEDAATLHKMGQGSWFTDSKALFKIIVMSPPEHLERVNSFYATKYGYTLPKVMEDEFRRKAREGALFEVEMKLKPFEAVAGLIDRAFQGFLTDELLLSCTLIRYQAIMPDVMAAYQALHGKTIKERVKDEVGGNYQKLLLKLLAQGQ